MFIVVYTQYIEYDSKLCTSFHILVSRNVNSRHFSILGSHFVVYISHSTAVSMGGLADAIPTNSFLLEDKGYADIDFFLPYV